MLLFGVPYFGVLFIRILLFKNLGLLGSPIFSFCAACATYCRPKTKKCCSLRMDMISWIFQGSLMILLSLDFLRTEGLNIRHFCMSDRCFLPAPPIVLQYFSLPLMPSSLEDHHLAVFSNMACGRSETRCSGSSSRMRLHRRS